MAAGAALAAKRGETSKSSLRGASRKMADSMTESQLEDFAATKRKNLPKKKNSGGVGNIWTDVQPPHSGQSDGFLHR
jgi:hypothetical protein